MSKRLSLADRIAAFRDEERANAQAPSPAQDSTPQDGSAVATAPRHSGGFVGKVLAQSNASLETRVIEAEKKAALLASGEHVVTLDPARIRRSVFANRHPIACTEQDPEFIALREQIRIAGRNTQAIKVRPVTDDPDYDYEIASGHRRHAACRDLGLQVHAIVVAMSNDQLHGEMLSENLTRADLSAYEYGIHYAKLIAMGEYATVRDVAERFGVSKSQVQRLMQFTALPDYVIEAFPDPRQIRLHWPARLAKAIKTSPSSVKAAAQQLIQRRESGVSMSPQKTLKALEHSVAKPDPKAGVAQAPIRGVMTSKVNKRPAIVLTKDAPEGLYEHLLDSARLWMDEHDPQ